MEIINKVIAEAIETGTIEEIVIKNTELNADASEE